MATGTITVSPVATQPVATEPLPPPPPPPIITAPTQQSGFDFSGLINMIIQILPIAFIIPMLTEIFEDI